LKDKFHVLDSLLDGFTHDDLITAAMSRLLTNKPLRKYLMSCCKHN